MSPTNRDAMDSNPLSLLDHDTYCGLASQAAGVEVSLIDNDDIDEESAELVLNQAGLRSWNEHGLKAQQRKASLGEKKRESYQSTRQKGVVQPVAAANKRVPATDGVIVDKEALEAVESIRSRYQEVHRRGDLFELARLALTAEVEGCKTLHGMNFRDIAFIGCDVLVSTHPDILSAIIRGDVARTYCRNKDFRDLLDSIRVHERGDNQPAIYMNQIGDVNGKSPTPNDILSVLPLIIGYVKGTDVDYIQKIDRRMDTARTKARPTDMQYRKYMYKGDRVSDGRQTKTLAFLTALEARCLAVPENERDEPLPGCLSEVGYTYTTETRLRNHREHRSSNYIMNLFDSALALKWPQRFTVHQFVIFLCVDATQGSTAEILFTRLAVGYTGNGGGFTHYPPGRSNESVQRFDTEQWQRWWKWTNRICQITENHAKQIQLWEAAEREVAAKSAQLQALREEIEQYEGLSTEETANLTFEDQQKLLAKCEVELAEREEQQASEKEELLGSYNGLCDALQGYLEHAQTARASSL